MADLKIYRFGPKTDGDGSMKDVLGGKGAGLADMCKLGVSVPPGFTIPCSASVEYNQIVSSKVMPAFTAKLTEEVMSGLSYLIKTLGYTPLMSVRSGARVSMPGMMDTILNVGLTSKTLPEWEKRIGKRAALDSYRRLIQMYGSVALDIRMELFEALLTEARAKAGVKLDAELPESALSRLVGKYLDLVQAETGKPFPDTINDQLMGAVFAVFDSWNNPRAQEYRKINDIPFEWGTAATVQAMVFGNIDDKSCTGVLFTRDPSTGEALRTGEYLINAQGEDVVAGIRTPMPIQKMDGTGFGKTYAELLDVCAKLEAHYRDMQDIEFTVESGNLYLLQTRTAKRSALAAFRVAQDLCQEGVLTKEEALQRVTREQLFAAMSDTIDPAFKTAPHLTGIAAGGGVVTGVAVFSSADAVNCTDPCILVTKETDPDDIAGMAKAVGILTATGGLTSHAAVVARGMNKACVVGATDLNITHSGAGVLGKPVSFGPGYKITIDGATGRVWVGINVPVISGGATESVAAILSWYFDTKEIAERIELHGRMSHAEITTAVMSARSKRVHVDLASLEYGSSPEQYQTLFQWLADALNACPAEEIVMDIRPLSVYYDQFDLTMFSMTGTPLSPAGLPAAFVKWAPSLVKRTTLTGVPFSPETKKGLLSMGFKLSGTVVKTFADLALANTVSVDVSQEVIDKVFGGDEGYQTALKMIEKTSGKKFSVMKPPAYWYDALQGT